VLVQSLERHSGWFGVIDASADGIQLPQRMTGVSQSQHHCVSDHGKQ